MQDCIHLNAPEIHKAWPSETGGPPSASDRRSNIVHGQEQMIRPLRAQQIGGRVAPADGSCGKACFSGGFKIADLVTDRDRAARVGACRLYDGPKLGRLAEQRSAAGVVSDPRRSLLPKNATDVRLGV